MRKGGYELSNRLLFQAVSGAATGRQRGLTDREKCIIVTDMCFPCSQKVNRVPKRFVNDAEASREDAVASLGAKKHKWYGFCFLIN